VVEETLEQGCLLRVEVAKVVVAVLVLVGSSTKMVV
jgi:hypothetical protein